MGSALELITGRAVAPGTTFTVLTALTGNSFTVRTAVPGSAIKLLQVWAKVQGAGTLRIRSPALHDNVQGIRLDTRVDDASPLLPWGVPQPLQSADNLVAEITGSATSGDVELACMLIHYQNLPGVEARFIDYATLQKRLKNIVTVENTLALGTSGDYSGEETLVSEFNLLKADTDYALVGYLVDNRAACVRWRGSETGNLGVGGPAEPTLRNITKDWFARLSREYNLPLIPVFNSDNRNAILVDGAQDENGADITVTSILAELSQA